MPSAHNTMNTATLQTDGQTKNNVQRQYSDLRSIAR